MTSSNDWQAYADSLIASGNATIAAVCRLSDGQPFAYTPGYGLQPAEVAAVTAHFGSSGTGLASPGGHFAGNYYTFVQGVSHGEIYFRRGSEGIVFCECAKHECIVVALHGDEIQAGPCRAAAGKLADHLNGTLPKQEDSGRWPAVVDPNDKSGDDPPPMTHSEWAEHRKSLWEEQMTRFHASATWRALTDGTYEGSVIEVEGARLDARYNGKYLYSAADQRWQHANDPELACKFGYTTGEKSGSKTLHPRWSLEVGDVPPYYGIGYVLERLKWYHGAPNYCGNDEIRVSLSGPNVNE